MAETTLPAVHRPPSHRQATIGGALALGVSLWASTMLIIGLTNSGDIPLPLFLVILTAAATSTIATVQLVINTTAQNTNADNLGIVLTSMGQLAASQEQLSAKMDKLDPWVIYTAAAADILGKGD